MDIIQKLERFKNTFRKKDSITLRYEDIIHILELINKPVETTNELPKNECPENYHAGPCECEGNICELFRKVV